MKYSYRFRTILVGSNNVLALDLPDEISLVSTLLFCDVQKNATWYLSLIDDVLSGKISHQKIGGNVCSLDIFPDYTTVLDTLSENAASCTIETSELRDIVRIWDKEQNAIEKTCKYN